MFDFKWKVYATKKRIVLFFIFLALVVSLSISMCSLNDVSKNCRPLKAAVSGLDLKPFQLGPLEKIYLSKSRGNQGNTSYRPTLTTQTPPRKATTDLPETTQEKKENLTTEQGIISQGDNSSPRKTSNEYSHRQQKTSDFHNGSEEFCSPYILPPSSDLGRKYPKPKFSNVSNVKVFLISLIYPCIGNIPGCFLKFKGFFNRCEYTNCKYTDDYSQAHVISFYVFRMHDEKSIPLFIRPPGQIWIMKTPEAACRQNNFSMLDLPRLKGQFNWTFTYRLDSDYTDVYGKLQRLEKPPVKDFESIYKTKKFNSAWFVSHCPTQSKRMLYVQRMTNVIEVHIYGACGDRNCSDPMGRNPRTSDNEVCFPLLSKRYFFYLAFENSLCKDYVTEKFFKIFKNVDIIPVVRGGVDYHSYFPPNTFVDASDFDSPEKLAEYLEDLAKDKKRYIQMLKAKNNYRTVALQKDMCEICKRLNNKIKPKTYPDLRNWFVKDQCHPPYDL